MFLGLSQPSTWENQGQGETGSSRRTPTRGLSPGGPGPGRQLSAMFPDRKISLTPQPPGHQAPSMGLGPSRYRWSGSLGSRLCPCWALGGTSPPITRSRCSPLLPTAAPLAEARLEGSWPTGVAAPAHLWHLLHGPLGSGHCLHPGLLRAAPPHPLSRPQGQPLPWMRPSPGCAPPAQLPWECACH